MSTTVNPDMGDSADLVAVWAARAADEKLGEDITVINVSQILGVCDWFVLTSGSSPRQVKAILDGWEARSPGRRQVMFRALMNVRPSHLPDPELFDFAGLSLSDGGVAPEAGGPPALFVRD